MSPRIDFSDPMQHVSVDENGCWVWRRHVGRDGYGRFGHVLTHRFYYELFTGEPIPQGLQIDHLCRNRSCVNPEHLEPVTKSENLRRGWAARRPEGADEPYPQSGPLTHCIRGHEFTVENTFARNYKKERAA